MCLGVLALILTPAWMMLRDVGQSTAGQDSRSVTTAEMLRGTEARAVAFHPEQSAALFVGVQYFSKDKALPNVPFSIDDAIDLAYRFVMEPNSRLVDPRRVVLALAGTARKDESKRRLNELIAAGAQQRSATQEDILEALKSQAALVGEDGIFIVSFATHGFNDHGVMLMLASDSVHENHETTISDTTVKEVAGSAGGHRSLVLFDACREPEGRGAQGSDVGPLPPAPIINAMAHIRGQVTMYAAAAGQFAYDDPDRRNGVFTAAVIDGLQCGAVTDARGLITADALTEHVEKQVGAWIRKNRDAGRESAIQYNLDGLARNMPLAACTPPSPPPPPPPHGGEGPPVARVEFEGSTLRAIGDDGRQLWTRQVQGQITHAEAGDLDGDERNEVVVSVGQGGDDSGKIMAFDGGGSSVWPPVDTNAVPNYPGSTGRMIVKTFRIADLFRKHRGEIVALSVDEDGRSSRISILESNGQSVSSGPLISGYWHPGVLQDIVIGRCTSRHAPRIIAFGVNDALQQTLPSNRPVSDVLMFDPKKVRGEAPPYPGKFGAGTQLWCGALLPENQQISSVEIVDHDHDSRNDIALHTSAGRTVYLDFDGHVLPFDNAGGHDAHFVLLAAKQSAATHRPRQHRTKHAPAR
jgi:hypothetical protein